MGSYMPEFALPLTSRDQGWIELRERLSRAARETHFHAFSNGAANSPALLVISGILAGLAMSIPLEPSNIGAIRLVDASTLFATQILQLDRRTRDNAITANAG
jgi:hypothetical protein